jgi:hypothetical protein
MIGNILLNTWAKGEPIDIRGLFRPFFLAFFITNFSLVTHTLDAVVKPFNTYTNAVIIDRTNEVIDLQNKADMAINGADDKVPIWKSVFNLCTLNTIRMEMENGSAEFFYWLCQIVCIAAKYGVCFLSYFIRVILTLFGPFAFALSLLPAFKNNIGSWMSSYLHALLFLPICNILQIMQAELMKTMLTDQINALESNTLAVDGSLTLRWTVSIFSLMFIFAYLFVPKMASMIITSSAGGVQSSLTSSVTNLAQIGGKGAGLMGGSGGGSGAAGAGAGAAATVATGGTAAAAKAATAAVKTGVKATSAATQGNNEKTQ